jgi:glycosyltransferase involved in cell wall biosynthesis
MKKPVADISLVAANYNNGPYLTEFIESILASSLLPAEMIIIDDGSTDESLEVLRRYELLPIARFIYLDQNHGFANALNKGIAAAGCKFIMRADPDDRLHPARIREQFDYLERHPGLSGLGCNVYYFHHLSGRTLNKSNFPLTVHGIAGAYARGEHGMQHPTVMVRSAALKGNSYRQEWVPAEDYDLFARLVNDGHAFENLPGAFYDMRVHPGSASSRLRYDTVKKTYRLRDEIFGCRTSIVRKWFYFLHIRMYRDYLLSTNPLRKAMSLAILACAYPQKILRRL